MKKLLLLICLAVSQITCLPGLKLHGPPIPSGSCPAETTDFEALTYNAGLAPGVVSMATPRIEPVAAALAAYRDTGVICLQEIWTEEARAAILAALDLPPERIFYADTRGAGDDLTGVNVCRPEQIDPIAACVSDRCAGVPDQDRTICALAQCRGKLIALHGWNGAGRDCLNCLISSVGQHERDIVDRCANGIGVSHAYDGQNGVMLISRWPLRKREPMLLPSSTANRVALFATIEPEGLEPIELACTHLSTWNEVPPSHRDEDGNVMFGDWDAEMSAQLDLIAARLKERAGSRPQLFLGDMNAGPELRGIHAAMPDVWNRILMHGFDSPAARAEPPFCSTCAENDLRDSRNGYFIDHVLARDPKGGTALEATCARRAFDGRQAFPGYDGLPVERNLSDHFGVIVGFRATP